MKYTFILSTLLLIGVISCQKVNVQPHNHDGDGKGGDGYICGEAVDLDGKIYGCGDQLFLWGGTDESWHFDITGWSLEPDQMKDYGYDRETFKALIDPQYTPSVQAAGDYIDSEPVIYMKDNNQVKIYPYSLMKYHEVINESVEGAPVMIAYCFLADLAAVYERTLCGKEFTFALSGYTYHEDQIWEGRDGFVLWDRDTQSLWWPLIGRAVSGTMQGELLHSFNNDKWGLSNWKDIREQYPSSWVLMSGQGMTPPQNWAQYNCSDLPCCHQ